MKHFVIGTVLGVLAFGSVAIATMGGQYSVNIHFVPPLVTGACSAGQFWTPPNVACALCFCMTGTLSRCVPQPGCIPNNSTNNATTTEATTTTASAAQNANASPVTEHVTPASSATAATTQPSASSSAPTAASSAPTEATSPTTAAPVARSFVNTNLIRKRRMVKRKF